MRNDKELTDRLKSLMPGEAVMHGVVDSVDLDKATCNVRVGGKLYLNASLRSVVTDDSGITVFPRIGSVVTCFKLQGSNRLIVIKHSEVDVFQLVIDNTVVFISNDGVRIERGNESLKKIINDLLDAILQMTVTTGVGPSGTPINFAQFEQIKTRLDNLLID